ncbi:MAG: 30S ribosomal protein S4 [Candidatus Adlerbacteria bacterium GW2011_GWC1_50_9]|uniref:Small ribosomal subunit protein uS4 n=1 Tax=Candidatus Adlerbacteria bacterium GW2011_GWC1_50_9 TaxID=1618608 RepID=A0A0G1WR73_9BACT|nr:MAG: 30S ribosomal protein S4 [Candidatus Adlerbacteria bacterium GW2011_GWC1_50_9]
MPRILEKKERALGEKLFLKGERCAGAKCVMVRRNYPPGAHGKRKRRASSEFGTLLREKQKGRLDNVVFRLGFSVSRRAAQQIIGHGHVLVNGKRATIPSIQVRVGDTISLKERTARLGLFQDLVSKLARQQTPQWLEIDPAKKAGRVVKTPDVDDIALMFDATKIKEFYSR